MTELGSLRNEIDKISVSTKMSDEDFMIHVLNNLTEEYNMALDRMESRLMLRENGLITLTIEDFQEKLSERFDEICERIANHKNGPITDETSMAAHAKQYTGICGKC